MAEFLMPSLGADMDAGTLVEWRKQPGDRVARGDIIAEVETDKGIIEVEVFTSGTVERHLVSPGTKVPVGTPLALLREEGAPASPMIPTKAPASLPPRADAPTPAAPPPAPALRVAPVPPESHPPSSRRKTTPAARRRATELGLDATTLVGTGPDGAVTLDDVERAAASKTGTATPTLPGGPSVAPPAPSAGGPGVAAPEDAKARMRHAVAAAMARSKREIPHYYVTHTVDLAPLLAFLEGFNAKAAIADRLIVAVPFLKAVALSLRDFPAFNGYFLDDRVVPSPGVHVGAAIALRGGGLVAPAIRDTDRSPLPELMNRFRDLVSRARAGTLRSSEMSDATITVTSLGDRGTEAVIGVIYPPQVAIVGFGRVVTRPWVVGGAVVPRPVVHLSLAADHRATDGHAGALFLSAIAERLMEPERL